MPELALTYGHSVKIPEVVYFDIFFFFFAYNVCLHLKRNYCTPTVA
jgi:hypothetical protein